MDKQIKKIISSILFLLLTVSFSHAATKGRILTDGKASLYKNGKLVNSFTKQGPVDENALVACDGICVVKIKGTSLIAKNKAKFAVKELGNSIHLYIESGKVDFAVSDTSKYFSFYTPDGYFLKTDGFVTPASNDSSVKGFVQVTDQGTEIGMDKGSMAVHTDEGRKIVRPGYTVKLAMVNIPDKTNELAMSHVPDEKVVSDNKAGAALTIESSTNGSDADATPGPTIAVGDEINWNYIVTNTGNVDLTNVGVTDDQDVTVTCPGNTLAIGASMICTASGKAVAGQYENIGTATGTPLVGANVTDTDPSHYLGSAAAPCRIFSWDCVEAAGYAGSAISIGVGTAIFSEAFSSRGRSKHSASPNQ